MNYVPTKEELIEDYFNSRMTHQEIAEKYGYKTRQVVNRWFKKYQLKSNDFMYEDKIIEFDGRYWHSDEEKEIIKDKFLRLKKYKVLHIFDDEYKINPQETLNKCIEFLSK
jgi:very-short-patch-repair endonuclease